VSGTIGGLNPGRLFQLCSLLEFAAKEISIISISMMCGI
jgi:hypothetical protein